MPSVNQLARIAKEAAEEAARIQRHYFRSSFETMTKESRYDRLTTADLESEKAITEMIRRAFPDHDILAEENSYGKKNSPWLWIVDPLDGTNNFSRGLPEFAVSLGVAYQGEVVCGVVQMPAHEEIFTAQKGEGAFLNGEPIRVSATDDLRDAMVSTGFFYDRGAMMEETLELIRRMFRREVVGIRRSGSAAIDICRTACGRYDIHFELQNQAWDFAAAALILQEAGGCISNRSGAPLPLEASSVVASNGILHKTALEILK